MALSCTGAWGLRTVWFGGTATPSEALIHRPPHLSAWCDPSTGDQSASDAAPSQWRATRGLVERSADGVRWEIVEVEPDLFHESYFVDVGPSGQVAVSQCRSEARNPGFYCYVGRGRPTTARPGSPSARSASASSE